MGSPPSSRMNANDNNTYLYASNWSWLANRSDTFVLKWSYTGLRVLQLRCARICAVRFLK